MVLKSLKPDRKRLADAVYEQLLGAISNCEFGPDDRLVQEKLAADLEISRTPVREALLRLEQEGILVRADSGGFRLHRMTEAEVASLYQARAAIEGHAARLLADRGTVAVHDRLRTTIRQAEIISDESARAYFDANRNIHRAFVAAADNHYLLEMFDTIWNRSIAFQLFATIERIDLAQSLGHHLTLLDVVISGDAAKAQAAFMDHIADGFALQAEALSMG